MQTSDIFEGDQIRQDMNKEQTITQNSHLFLALKLKKLRGWWQRWRATRSKPEYFVIRFDKHD
jgi:hypothetical protein